MKISIIGNDITKSTFEEIDNFIINEYYNLEIVLNDENKNICNITGEYLFIDLTGSIEVKKNNENKLENIKNKISIIANHILSKYKSSRVIIYKRIDKDEKVYDYLAKCLSKCNFIEVSDNIVSKDVDCIGDSNKKYVNWCIEKSNSIIGDKLNYKIRKFNTEVFEKEVDKVRFSLESEFDNNICVNLAKKIQSGELYVNLKVNDYIKFEENDIKNIYNFISGKTNTYKLYFFSLGHAFILSKASIILNDKKMLDMAIEFVKVYSRYDDLKSESEKDFYCWYDHSVAERSETISYIMYAIIKLNYNLEKLNVLYDLLQKNLEWLYNDKNYTYNHNHGVIEDKALLLSSIFINNENSEKYIGKAIVRVTEQIKNGYTKDFIHFENSTGYHIGMIQMLITLKCLVNFSINDAAYFLEDVIKGALEYLVYCYKPNKIVNFFGDTLGNNIDEKPVENYKDVLMFDSPMLKYINTNGKEGKKPNNIVKWFENSGYVFFRETWEPDNMEESSWISFKAGYSSSTHKHRDDLSVCLYAEGYDILIDPGMYNYVPGDTIADYMMSNFAHNTLIVDDKDYSTTLGNSNKVGILKCVQNEFYDYSVGYSRIFEGVEIYRHIYYMRPNILIIRDQIISEEEHKYSQIFHLGPYCTSNKNNNNIFDIKLGDTNKTVNMYSLSDIDSSNVYYGRKERKMSLTSLGFGKSYDTETIEFNKYDKSCELTTIISWGDADLKNNLKISKNGVTINGANIEFKDIESVQFKGLKVDIDNDYINIRNMTVGNKYTYAYYIVEEKNYNVETKTQYDYDSLKRIKLLKKQDYSVIYYIKTPDGQVVRGIGAKIKYDGEKFDVEEFNEENKAVSLGEKYVTYNESGEYKFCLNIKSKYPYSIRWYIYKNGSSDDFRGINDNDTLEYKFKDRAEYTIYYKVTVKYYKEIDYGKFNNVIIK